MQDCMTAVCWFKWTASKWLTFYHKRFKGYYFNPSGMTSLQITPQKCMEGDSVLAFLSSTLCQESDVQLDGAETRYDSWEKNTVPEDSSCHSIFM